VTLSYIGDVGVRMNWVQRAILIVAGLCLLLVTMMETDGGKIMSGSRLFPLVLQSCASL
jgi:hypothetical membrane protein